VIAFGGGVSNDGEFLLSPIREYAKKYAFFRKHAKIVVAEMRNDAGIVGAAMLFKQKQA
jgi:glucokinase